MPRNWSVAAALVLAGSFAASQAHAVPFGFDCLTNDSAGDCAIGEAQIAVDVTDAGGGQVAFTFTNAGPEESSLADVYFDADGSSLLSIASIVNGAGVSFSVGASPPNLPGANNAIPPFVTTSGLSADSDAPVPQNGVNPGESVQLLLDLQGGATFADVLAEIADGTIRVGVRVQSFESGGGESFLLVPEPSTFGLLALGLVGFVVRRPR